MTTLIDLGYNEFGMSPLVGGASGLISTQNVSSISGSKIVGGIIASVDGKMSIDLNKRQVTLYDEDGVARMLFGYQEGGF